MYLEVAADVDFFLRPIYYLFRKIGCKLGRQCPILLRKLTEDVFESVSEAVRKIGPKNKMMEISLRKKPFCIPRIFVVSRIESAVSSDFTRIFSNGDCRIDILLQSH